MQNRKIVQCENCYKFYNEAEMIIVQVKRKGVADYWNEYWCPKCNDTINQKEEEVK